MIGALGKSFHMVGRIRPDTRVLAIGMMLASGLLLSAAVSSTVLSEISQSHLLAIMLWASSVLGFVLGLMAIKVSRRETWLGSLIPLLLALHRELIDLDYPLAAEDLSPVGDAIASLLPEQKDWIMLLNAPGVLIRGETMRSRYLRVLSDREGDGGWRSPAESILRDHLEGESREGSLISLSHSSRDMALLVGNGKSTDGDISIGIAIAAVSVRYRGWTADFVEVALTLAAEHLSRMLRDAVSWRGRITRGGAHDPLLLVRALVHELSGELSASIIHLERSLEGKRKEHSGLEAKIRRSLMRSSYWVDLLRDIPLLRDDFLAIERRQVPLRAALIDVIDDVRPAWPDCVFHLRMDEDPAVIADRHLRSIMRNLLHNAASYSPIGGTVDIEVTHEGKFARVFVADQGPGVSAACLQTIFDPYQFESNGDDRAETRMGQGMGIGLGVARIIARAYGGDIRCHPKPPAGGGKFEVILPLAELIEHKEVGDHA